MQDVDNTQDVIDSRDVIERIEELKELRDDVTADADDLAELRALEALSEECEGYAPDWTHGETLIRRSYWPAYVRELADDIGETAPDTWPGRCIDWDQAAEELEADYMAVDFDGVEYLMRAG